MDVRTALEQVMVLAAWREPGCTFVDTPAIAQVITPSIPFSYANTVYRFAGDDAELARVLAPYGEHRLPVRFVVSPSSEPRDLAERLLERGFVLVSELAAMWRSTAQEPAALPLVEVEPLSPSTFDDYIATSAAGWTMTEAQAANLRRSVERDYGLGAYQAFLARLDGVAAGAGVVRAYDGFGYLQGSAVHPRWRGRGVYRALVAHRMRVLREAGVEVALIHARRNTSAPICERLGFRTEFYSTMYERGPQGTVQ